MGVDVGNHKKVSIQYNQDIIEVRLIDNSFIVYFKQKSNINNRKQMEQLMEDLKDKGVNLIDFL